MLPTFVVIGAMKCGTTSLYYYLDAHPEIGMSIQKETDYFLPAQYDNRGSEWYLSRFREQARARGECSPNYTKRHLFPDVAERMHDLVPGVKLVYMVRDPLDRIISHYVGNRVRSQETRPFSEAVTDGEKNNYVLTSKYYYQLEPYLEHFGSDQLLVRSLNALQHCRNDVLSDIHRFLGVEARGDEDISEAKYNTTGQKRMRGRWYRWLSSLVRQSVKDTVRPYIPWSWIPGASVARPQLSPQLREKLASQLRDDVDALRRVTGRSFDEWDL